MAVDQYWLNGHLLVKYDEATAVRVVHVVEEVPATIAEFNAFTESWFFEWISISDVIRAKTDLFQPLSRDN